MRLGVKPLTFLVRLLVFFGLTYVLWIPVAPGYTYVLASLTRGFLHVTESLADAHGQVTEMEVRQTKENRPAIFFAHRLYPQVVQSGIPAEWVQANLVLLIPLMLAVPARSWVQRFGRLGAALGIALALQVLDIAVTVKAMYASFEPLGYGAVSSWLYQFADAFTQSMDTQLFPFAIWAGIHFKQLMGWDLAPSTPAQPVPSSRVEQQSRKKKAAKRAASRG